MFAFFILFSPIFATTAAAVLSESKNIQTTIRLNNGYEMPIVGLGTFEDKPGEAERAVKDAIDSGYRHIDTAFVYGNEKEVGNAIRAKITEGVIKREDIFVTTKLFNTFHEPDQVPRAFQKSFDNLNLTYIDLYLMHYPIAYARRHKDGSQKTPESMDDVAHFPLDANGNTITIDVDYVDTWKAMEPLVATGRIRSIGVSNFNSEQVERVNSIATIKPVTNQVECHPNLNQRRLIEFCAARNITVTAYSPLGRPHVAGEKKLALSDPKVHELAKKYNKSPAQIILRYTIQNGAIVIPKSTNKRRIQENINVFDFQLSDEDMDILHGLNSNTRLVPFKSDANHKDYPFKNEF